MDLMLNADQQAVLDAVEGIALDFTSTPSDFHGFALYSLELDSVLADNGFFEIATTPELGRVAAAAAVERLARLPFTAEIALSMLLGHLFDESLPRPFALVENGRPGRFVAQAATVFVLDGERVGICHPTEGQYTELPDSLYAYPMAKLDTSSGVAWLPQAQGRQVLTWLRVALACEMAGLLQGAIDSTVEYVSVRKQFGRPIGTFQAIRHRLAECTVLASGVRLLALQAAWSGDEGDAAIASYHAQDSATRVLYDVHQMSGAMGMTLEMDLHLWTYRMKALLSELGGRSGQAAVAGHAVFGA